MQQVIYTDLDGTLLDFKDYSYALAAPLVHELTRRRIPLIFCSSKTKAEQEYYREALNVRFPFIVENGSAVVIPKRYFSFDIRSILTTNRIEEVAPNWVVVLGESRTKITKAIHQTRLDLGLDLRGYSDLTLNQISEITQLDNEFARRAATRDFSETLLMGNMSGSAFLEFRSRLERQGLICVSGGKFHTVMGANSDKGRAVELLTQLFRYESEVVETVGIGDSANDLPMLRAVDHPFLVQNNQQSWLDTDDPRIRKIDGVGPEGWANALRTVGAV